MKVSREEHARVSLVAPAALVAATYTVYGLFERSHSLELARIRPKRASVRPAAGRKSRLFPLNLQEPRSFGTLPLGWCL